MTDQQEAKKTRKRQFGGFTPTELAFMLGLPRRRVLTFLQDTERRLGRAMTAQDASMFIYQVVDARLRTEIYK